MGQDGGVVASYIPVPESASTVDALTGAVLHTIIIMRNATGAPPPPVLLRVTPKEQKSSMPVISIFQPFARLPLPASGNATAWQAKGVRDEGVSTMRIAQPYAAASMLDGKEVPVGYQQVNYSLMLAIYVIIFFLSCICIEWYYLVVTQPGYEDDPMLTTALFVRTPIWLASASIGALMYVFAQVFIVLAYFTALSVKNSDKAGKKDILLGKWVVLAVAFIFNVVHLITWGIFYTANGDLPTFNPFLREKVAGWMVSNGATSLFLPLMSLFLIVEPTTWCLITLGEAVYDGVTTVQGS